MNPNPYQSELSTVRNVIVRIAFGVIVVPILYGAICLYFLYSTYVHEGRMASEIQAGGGRIYVSSEHPSWIPEDVAKRVPLWERVAIVRLAHQQNETPQTQLERVKGFTHLSVLGLNDIPVSDSDLEEFNLKAPTQLGRLMLRNTKITDAGLVHLKRFTSLRSLDLNGTQITNDGLEHLKEITGLGYLDLSRTSTTKDSRHKLRKVLPRCVILPSDGIRVVRPHFYTPQPRAEG